MQTGGQGRVGKGKTDEEYTGQDKAGHGYSRAYQIKNRAWRGRTG
jgi:hypothetical protein